MEYFRTTANGDAGCGNLVILEIRKTTLGAGTGDSRDRPACRRREASGGFHPCGKRKAIYRTFGIADRYGGVRVEQVCKSAQRVTGAVAFALSPHDFSITSSRSHLQLGQRCRCQYEAHSQRGPSCPTVCRPAPTEQKATDTFFAEYRDFEFHEMPKPLAAISIAGVVSDSGRPVHREGRYHHQVRSGTEKTHRGEPAAPSSSSGPSAGRLGSPWLG
jgi:hypothetical protein